MPHAVRSVVACVVASVTFLLSPAASAGPWRFGPDGHRGALEEQERDGVPVLVYFRTEWCGYCKQLDQKVLAKDKVSEYLAPFAKVQINPEDGPEHRALAEKYGVRGYPTLLVIMPGKPPKKVSSGNGNPEGFLKGMKAVAGTPAMPERTADAPLATPVLVIPGVPQDIFDLQEQGRHGEAVARLNRLIDTNAKNPGLRLARAISYRGMKRHADAAEDLELYLRAKPDDADARVLLARSYLNLTMHADAAETLVYLVDKKPSGEALWLLAEAETKIGKKAEAKEHYAQACKAGYKAACKTK